MIGRGRNNHQHRNQRIYQNQNQVPKPQMPKAPNGGSRYNSLTFGQQMRRIRLEVQDKSFRYDSSMPTIVFMMAWKMLTGEIAKAGYGFMLDPINMKY